MPFIIKHVLPLLFLMSSISSWSQDSLQVNTQKINDNPVGIFSAGVYWANPLGSNFVNEGLDLKPGFALNLRAYVLPRFTIGAQYNFMRGEVSDVRITGNYDRTNIWMLGGTLGYEFDLLPRFDLMVLGGVGSAVYRNKKGSVKFTDRGLALWLAPEFSYSVAQNIAFYITPEYRFDRLHIDVPQPLENTFKNVSYVSVGAGVRFMM